MPPVARWASSSYLPNCGLNSACSRTLDLHDLRRLLVDDIVDLGGGLVDDRLDLLQALIDIIFGHVPVLASLLQEFAGVATAGAHRHLGLLADALDELGQLLAPLL